jgi:hypothetical protein
LTPITNNSLLFLPPQLHKDPWTSFFSQSIRLQMLFKVQAFKLSLLASSFYPLSYFTLLALLYHVCPLLEWGINANYCELLTSHMLNIYEGLQVGTKYLPFFPFLHLVMFVGFVLFVLVNHNYICGSCNVCCRFCYIPPLYCANVVSTNVNLVNVFLLCFFCTCVFFPF